MANKKCPKCGEDNPAEAVMCWACYTPLTAGAGAAMTAGVGMGGAGAATMPRTGPMGVPGAAADDGSAKKQIDPKLFLAGGLLLVGAIIALFTTGILGGGSSAVDTSLIPQDPTTSTRPSSSGFQPMTQASSGGGGGLGSSGATTQTTTTTTQGPTFSVIVSPNPQFATATFAITPSQPGVSPQQAVSLAKTARQSMVANGKWKNTQIAVFNSADGAQSFRQYMNQRRGAPLTLGDYQALASQNTWANVIVYYETRGNSERVSEPAKNPNGWWGSN